MNKQAVYFSSNHLSSTKILAITAATYGQRAYIGKNCSDQNVPEYYVEKMEDSLAGTEEFLKWVQDQWGMEGLIKAVVTPRFVSD